MFNPSITFLIWCIIELVVPIGQKVNEISINILKTAPLKNVNSVNRHNMFKSYFKYKIKIIKSLSPIRIYLGIGGNNIFFIKKSTRPAYCMCMVTNCANLTISLPIDLLK